MHQGITGLWNGLTGRNKGVQRRHEDPSSPLNDLQTQIEAAHREWQAAQQHFQMVHEPELVDHAIYQIEAAQRRYMYLLRQLREGQQGAEPEQAYQEGS